MKNTVKFLALIGSAFMIASCAQPSVPDVDDEYCNEDIWYTADGHPFTSTKIETQIRSEDADYTLGGYLSKSIEIYKDEESLIKSRTVTGRHTFYSMWDFHDETENYGSDPFLEYDDAFFEDHILIVTGADLPPNITLYFGGLSDELQKETGVNGGNPFHKVFIDEVSPTDEVMSSSTEDPVYCFIPVEVPDDTTVDAFFAKYNSDGLLYWKWEVFEDELSHCFKVKN